MSARRGGLHERWAESLRSAASHGEQGVIARRVFLVGCPRSGTTLLQSLLHAHQRIVSLPETHFLPRLLGCEEHRRSAADQARGAGARLARWRRRVLADAGLVDPARARDAWRGLHAMGLQASMPRAGTWRLAAHADAFVGAMDAHALGMHKAVWLEKTPDHLFYLQRILALVPQARVIHLQRDGRQVVASLHKAAREYPAWRPYLDVSRCVDRWATAVRESRRWLGQDGHLHVSYEDLVDRPDETLDRIVLFLGTEPDPGLWSRYRRMAGGLIRADEPWKRMNLQPIVRRDRFAEVFDSAQRRWVEAALERERSSGLASACPSIEPHVSAAASSGIARPHR